MDLKKMTRNIKLIVTRSLFIIVVIWLVVLTYSLLFTDGELLRIFSRDTKNTQSPHSYWFLFSLFPLFPIIFFLFRNKSLSFQQVPQLISLLLFHNLLYRILLVPTIMTIGITFLFSLEFIFGYQSGSTSEVPLFLQLVFGGQEQNNGEDLAFRFGVTFLIINTFWNGIMMMLKKYFLVHIRFYTVNIIIHIITACFIMRILFVTNDSLDVFSFIFFGIWLLGSFALSSLYIALTSGQNSREASEVQKQSEQRFREHIARLQLRKRKEKE